MAKPYNGHPSKAAWNVSLWIHNDEGLYRMAREFRSYATSNKEAASRMLEALHRQGVTETPDGFTYSKSTIELAMSGILD